MSIEQKIDRMDSKIEILIDQVGRMTEGITDLRIAICSNASAYPAREPIAYLYRISIGCNVDGYY